MAKHADISSIYDRGAFKRQGFKKRRDSNDALTLAMSRFGARLKDVDMLRGLARGKSANFCIDVTTHQEIFGVLFNNYGRAVAALNKVKSYGEYYILPKRTGVDPANKFTVKINSRTIKSFVKPGEVIGFTVTRL